MEGAVGNGQAHMARTYLLRIVRIRGQQGFVGQDIDPAHDTLRGTRQPAQCGWGENERGDAAGGGQAARQIVVQQCVWQAWHGKTVGDAFL